MVIQNFKGKVFNTVNGTVHPQYSIDTFQIEENDIREKYWNIKEGDTVIDVGASYGSYSLTACAMGAAVLAFEPEISVYEDLVRNIGINDWTQRCIPFNLALGKNEEDVDMRLYAPHWPEQCITSTYKTDTLDNIRRRYKIHKIDWIKIDVEGMEEDVILGGLETIRGLHPTLLIECHDFMRPGISNAVKALLPEYSFEEITRDPCIMLLGK